MASVVAFEVSQLRNALNWVDHTDTVIADSRATLRKIVDAETGMRGFLLTGRQEFLEPWQQSAGIAHNFSKLEELVGDNPVQKQRFGEIRSAFVNWLDYSNGMVELRRSGGAYSDFERNLEGKRLMDDIRNRFGDVIDVEQELRDLRLKHASRLDQNFNISLALLSLALVTTLVLFSRYQLRNLSGEFESALRTSEGRAALERERKQWFLTLLRSVRDAVIATDAEGRITFINPAAERLTGWTMAEARTQSIEKVFRTVNADTREIGENPVDKVRRLNSDAAVGSHTVLICKDGSEITIDNSSAPITNDSGEIVGVILVFRDVTQQSEMERTLRTTERLALAGRITSSVAHEIHNPLDTVGNLLYLIQSDSNDVQTSRYAELASQQLQRVHQVTRSILGLYRESQSPVSILLADILQDVLALLDAQIKAKEAQITCKVVDGATIEGFPTELRQLFANLIHNAIDAIPHNGHITIECTSPSQKDICVSITDSGQGISREDRARLFQPLFTTKGEHGTGLGLWVSKWIVEKHGGSIEATNNEASSGTGATFSVTFPRRFPPQLSKSVEA